ncbi:hypothetical protein [Streptococcus oricebi]|uniref:Lipoprotein n=1 Tax=Streptococcus oricebi TaxID=1547447 RepID=A0ABS5B4D5_9STRE|nr:hypothetical protein [Streptococcus oricebi]MBP2623670.1 hypothetical protein [Streptococcus oricebi]
MKRRTYIFTLVTLTCLALVACSSQSGTDKSQASTEQKTSSTSSASQEAKASQSSSDQSSTDQASFLTDEEIKAAKTVGDFKTLNAKWIDSLMKMVNDLGVSVAESNKEAYQKQVDALKTQLEDTKKEFDNGMAQLGADSVEVPDGTRQAIAENLKGSLKFAQKMLDENKKLAQNG